MIREPEQLSPEQQVAVNSRRGHLCLVACPGSGKTTAIVARAKAILAEGCPLNEFLSLTFTVEAAKEMNKRAGYAKSEYKIFRTFHSWALAFVDRERLLFPYRLKPMPLAPPYIAARTLGHIVSRLSDVDFKEVASYISLMKRRGISPQQAAQEESQHEAHWLYVRAYSQYEEAMRDQGLMDFDSILCESAKLLERNATVRARWQVRYLQIDEAQDADAIQWRCAQLISEKHGNVFAVGDENQGIFSWRGSESDLIVQFKTRFSNAVVLPLSTNYRSTRNIVEYCKEIAPYKNETIEKFNTPNECGVPLEFKLYPADALEAEATVNSLTDPANSAVLVRTNRQLRALETACIQRQMKYKLLGKSGFWKRPEVRDVLSWIYAVCEPSDEALLRAFKSNCDVTRFLSKRDTIEKQSTLTHLGNWLIAHPRKVAQYRGPQADIVAQLLGLLSTFQTTAAQMTAGRALGMIAEQAGFLSFYDLDEDEKAIDNDPRENILEVVKAAEGRTSLREFLEFAKWIMKASYARKNTCVVLSTIHQAKGKEWGNVFVAGVNDGVLPHKKGDPEEEKRIFFVACSRAANRLVVSANGLPSEFIRDRIPKRQETIDLWPGYQLESGARAC